MSIETDLDTITLQEQQLRFTSFNANTAWELGNRLRQKALERNQAVSIDITVNGQQLFFSAMAGTSPDNAEWIRRKRNVAMRFHRSSYFKGLELKLKQTDLATSHGLSIADYAPHGGVFPLWVRELMVGTIAVSGLPQRDDHKMVVEVLAEMLGTPFISL